MNTGSGGSVHKDGPPDHNQPLSGNEPLAIPFYLKISPFSNSSF